MEWISPLSSAFLLGLLGGFHCLGMCGPLVLAIPGTHPLRALLYHSGRILTYMILGLLAGVLGFGIALAGWQQWISIISGVLMLIIIWMPRLFYFKSVFPLGSLLAKIPVQKSTGFMFLAGMGNGLLPCGLVYIALAGSLSAGSLVNTIAYMAVFGFGTFPLLWLLSFAGKTLSFSMRNRMRKLIPYAATCVALLLILRGLNLGIPYISPKQDASGQVECCKHNKSNY